MPRYFFHVHDGSNFIDEVGTEFRNELEARKHAVIASGEALRDHGAKFWNEGEWTMNVVDENGATVCSLKFSAEHPT